VLFSLAIALYVNLLFLILRVGSDGGQTTYVQVEAIGDQYRLTIDGKQAIPDPTQTSARRVQLDTPDKGTIALTLRHGVPSMPDPQGIDSIVVRDVRGQLLFRDDFNSIDTTRWEVTQGAFRAKNGILEAVGKGDDNVLQLKGQGYEDVIVTVVYRNAMQAAIEVRKETKENGFKGKEPGVAYYSFNLVRDFPVYVEGRPGNGEWWTEFGLYVHVMKRDLFKSLGTMLVGSYPLVLGGLAIGVAVTLVLSAVGTIVMRLGKRRPRWLDSAGARLSPHAWSFVVFTAAFSIAATCVHIMWEYYRRVPHLPDEAAYMHQANLFAAGKITQAIPPVKQAFYFWDPNFLYEHGSNWVSIYPLGHSLTMAPSAALGAMWLFPPMLGGVCVLLLYMVGRRMFDARTGAIAALLMAFSPFFLMQTASFMSHTTWLFYMLLSLYFLLNKQRLWWGLVAGIGFGMALNTRPTETAMLVPAWGIVLLAYLLPRVDRRKAIPYIGAFVVGGALMVGLSMAYNAATTGDPLVSAYLDWDYGGATLGFKDGFTFDVGLRNEQALMMAFVLILNNWPTWVGLTFIFLPFMLGTRNFWDYWCLLCSLLVISVYVLYQWSGIYEGPRYWYQAVPFAMLLTARGAEIAGRLLGDAASWLRESLTGRRLELQNTGRLVVYGFMLVLVLWGAGSWLFKINTTWEEADAPQVQNTLDSVKDLYKFDDRLIEIEKKLKLQNALVLVPPCGAYQSWGCYATVFLKNNATFDGRVVWARYDKDLNDRTVAAFPGRTVWVMDFDTFSVTRYVPPERPPIRLRDAPLADRPSNAPNYDVQLPSEVRNDGGLTRLLGP
jgi:hypothetical protein